MTATARALTWLVLAVALLVVIWHHWQYFRRARPLSFSAFLETAGWLIVVLVAVAALYGGWAHPGTRILEIASGVVGVLFIIFGAAWR
ncbi:MAG TPA: hypothetical protein VNN19_09025 [bacterium]|nr:hypothetical protein [bacterium]